MRGGDFTRDDFRAGPKHVDVWSELAAERLADLGITAFSPSEDIEWPPLHLRKPLLDAAEAEGVGLRIQPKAGLAAVFWTHTPDGLDKYSWHARARVPPEATDGKLIAQKFKSLPVQWRPTRKADAARLPVELSPPMSLGSSRPLAANVVSH